MQYKKCLKPEIRNGNHQQITVFDNMKVMKIFHWASKYLYTDTLQRMSLVHNKLRDSLLGRYESTQEYQLHLDHFL